MEHSTAASSTDGATSGSADIIGPEVTGTNEQSPGNDDYLADYFI